LKIDDSRQRNAVFNGAGLARNLQVLLDHFIRHHAVRRIGLNHLVICFLCLFGGDLKPGDHDAGDFSFILRVPEEVDASKGCADRSAQKIGLLADIFVRSAEPGHG
jgi:hypothetical protein